ncbi:MAG: hypothetical protein WC291_12270 [Thermodesulfovibrionales bacterium]
MKKTIGFVIFVLAIVGLLYSISGKKFPRIPDNPIHKGIASEEVCMSCHGPDKEQPLKKEHPPKFECFKCHKTKRGQETK